MPTKVLLADDDPRQRRHFAALLEAAGYAVVLASSGAEALERLRAEGASGIAVCVADLEMSGQDALAVTRQAGAAGPGVPVVALAPEAGLERAVEAMRAGASDVVAKSAGAERLDAAIRNALAPPRVSGEARQAAERRADRLTLYDPIAKSPATLHAVRLARRASRSDVPVLIEGESGTGKAMFARVIHGESTRADRPFVAVNCGALAPELADAALFGDEAGAFSGAAGRRDGYLRQAAGGTLFLDGIGELPQNLQAALLRALEAGEVDPAGGTGPARTDVRLISASDRDLRALVDQGRFRHDLFYRISVLPIKLPPLRERREDIPALARHFVERARARNGAAVEDFSPEAMARLVRAPWPGNIREFENAVQRALVMAEGSRIEAEDLSLPGNAGAAEGRAPGETGARDPFVGPDGHVRPLRRIEAEAIRTALRLYRGRMAEAARRLGIGRSTLYRKLDELQLDRNGEG